MDLDPNVVPRAPIVNPELVAQAVEAKRDLERAAQTALPDSDMEAGDEEEGLSSSSSKDEAGQRRKKKTHKRSK